ncbi:DinB family protein [Nocardia sp. NBC_01329]|uniref:DinB family protein n=1 Tax=Nocardia sp. NBC_01329 TaxID=2903594 RepID=UPI002E0FD4A7|nr:DinB family protein [Nocardia sp. NBC_01329]
MSNRRDLLRWQFDLVWSLSQVHFEALTDDDTHWAPARVSWTVHRGTDDVWRPDFAEIEPDPIPVPTIGWLTWHIGWWWSSAIAHAEGRPVPERTEVHWPGDTVAALARLAALREQWLVILDGAGDAELDAPASYPWPADAGLTVAHLAAWVAAELMKNVSEIGQLRLLRAAGPAR